MYEFRLISVRLDSRADEGSTAVDSYDQAAFAMDCCCVPRGDVRDSELFG